MHGKILDYYVIAITYVNKGFTIFMVVKHMFGCFVFEESEPELDASLIKNLEMFLWRRTFSIECGMGLSMTFG